VGLSDKDLACPKPLEGHGAWIRTESWVGSLGPVQKTVGFSQEWEERLLKDGDDDYELRFRHQLLNCTIRWWFLPFDVEALRSGDFAV
jgi:hypothetical protein